MKTSSTSGEGRARRAKSLTATLGVMATVAALSIPVAMPATASALPRTGFCGMVERTSYKYQGEGDLRLMRYWDAVAKSAGCWGS